MSKEALLGLASCRELLEELITRLEVHFDILDAEEEFKFFLTTLPEEVLNYRTVNDNS